MTNEQWDTEFGRYKMACESAGLPTRYDLASFIAGRPPLKNDQEALGRLLAGPTSAANPVNRPESPEIGHSVDAGAAPHRRNDVTFRRCQTIDWISQTQGEMF